MTRGRLLKKEVEDDDEDDDDDDDEDEDDKDEGDEEEWENEDEDDTCFFVLVADLSLGEWYIQTTHTKNTSPLNIISPSNDLFTLSINS